MSTYVLNKIDTDALDFRMSIMLRESLESNGTLKMDAAMTRSLIAYVTKLEEVMLKFIDIATIEGDEINETMHTYLKRKLNEQAET